MPELVAKKKSKPAINTFDFSFFENITVNMIEL